MVATVVAEFGAIDVLVNNAGVFPRVDFLAMTEADWDTTEGLRLLRAYTRSRRDRFGAGCDDNNASLDAVEAVLRKRARHEEAAKSAAAWASSAPWRSSRTGRPGSTSPRRPG